MRPTETPATPAHPDPPAWFEVLRMLREARGVTLDGWGAQLGVSRTTVQRWERGERAPDPGAETALIAYCGEAGLFRTYARGPLAGLSVTAELLADLLADARWSVARRPREAAPAVAPAAIRAEVGHEDDALPSGNLPVYLTSFIGRVAELAQLRETLPGTRLLTLTGAGGSGKTRLAAALAESAREDFADGVRWADLAPLADPDLLPQVVAAALAVRAVGGQTPTDALREALRSRQMLLVLDNSEHLLPAAAALVESLLRAAPRLTVLATSRESLGVGGELVWRAPPLSLPREPAASAGSDAVRLFLERARLRRPALALSATETAAAIEICARLDGMPLAIELAAARINVLSTAQILDRLEDRFRLLTGGGTRTLPRHQTLRATMDWSYALLTESERAVLRALSVFAGGFTLEAAEAVVGDEERADDASVPASPLPVPSEAVLDLITHLVDKSLLIAEEHEGAARYRMLETVRQYAAEQLVAADEEAAARDRCVRWCIELAGAVALHRPGGAHRLWLDRIAAEHDTIRAVLGWCLSDAGRPADGLHLANVLSWFWEVRGHHGEGRRWLAALLARGEAASPHLRAAAANRAAWLAREQGDLDEAIRLHELALALAREVENAAEIAQSLSGLGIVADVRGDYAQARALREQTLAIRRQIGERFGIATALSNFGIFLRGQGETERALALYEEALALFREEDDARLVANTLLNIGNALRDRPAIGEATARYREALALFQSLQDRLGVARCLEGLAANAVVDGDAERSARLAGAAAALREAIAVPIPEVHRPRFEQTTGAARLALGEAAFAAAWTAGGALTLDGAVAEAVAEPPA